MNLVTALNGIGFREVEAKVYLATLELGESTAAAIAKKARIKRPSVYVLLKDLIQKGFASSYTRQGKLHFAVRDPGLIIAAAQEKTETAKSALPELAALLKTSQATSKPRIQYYSGVDGLIAIMEDTIITGNKTILGWADVGLAWDTLHDYYPTYIRKKNERHVAVRGIFVDNEMGRRFQERGKTEKREARLVPANRFPMSNEINIYDDKIAIIAHRDLMGVIIQNKDIADTQRSIFELGWEMAGILEKENQH